MFQKGMSVTVRLDVPYLGSLIGKTGTVTDVFPGGEKWTYDVEFPDFGTMRLFHFELDDAAKTE
jgi:hypothetical protein